MRVSLRARTPRPSHARLTLALHSLSTPAGRSERSAALPCSCCNGRPRRRHGHEGEERLATLLATRAQELSLDRDVDSPFAILAKENDILWGGGRPDDITVIVSTVVDTTKAEPPAEFKPFAGPGEPAELPPPPVIVDASKGLADASWSADDIAGL